MGRAAGRPSPAGEGQPEAQKAIRHFSFLADDDTKFALPPSRFGRDSPRSEIAYGLGASLYTPALDSRVAGQLARRLQGGLTSTVLCLEDSIADDQVAAAEANLGRQLGQVADCQRTSVPLLFVRPRDPGQILRLARRLGGSIDVITGFVLPKFSVATGPAWLEAIGLVAATVPQALYVMPVLEGPDVLYPEKRMDELFGVAELLEAHSERVLAVRVGGTDLCGLLGLRRRADQTIYELEPIRNCIADIVNIFRRATSETLVVGPVWEYFGHPVSLELTRSRRPQSSRLPADATVRHLNGLIAETLADQGNGLVGKTVIHPQHVRTVNALGVVSFEDYHDAAMILAGEGGGALASVSRSRMNEPKPHGLWAARTLARARAFGVLHPGLSFRDLLDVTPAAC